LDADMPGPTDWIKKAAMLLPRLNLDRCVNELFDCGLITFDFPEGL
jgi:hypothetical protein